MRTTTLPFLDPPPERSRTRKEFAKGPAIEPPTNVCDGCDRPAISLSARGDQWLCGLCSSIRGSNPHETAARLRKALALADTLSAVGGDAQAAVTMTEADWELAARGAGMARPSIQTRVEVVTILVQRAQRKAAAHA
jgi:hypothetical protein